MDEVSSQASNLPRNHNPLTAPNLNSSKYLGQYSPTVSSHYLTMPVQASELSVLLEGYDPDLKDYLVSGFTNGFHINCVNKKK